MSSNNRRVASFRYLKYFSGDGRGMMDVGMAGEVMLTGFWWGNLEDVSTCKT